MSQSRFVPYPRSTTILMVNKTTVNTGVLLFPRTNPPSKSRLSPPQYSDCRRGTILGDTFPAFICRETGVFAKLAPGDTRGTRRLCQSLQVLLHSTNLPSRLAGVTRTYFMDEPILFNLRIFHPRLLEQASLLVAPLL